jgi:hypothetical protein
MTVSFGLHICPAYTGHVVAPLSTAQRKSWGCGPCLVARSHQHEGQPFRKGSGAFQAAVAVGRCPVLQNSA